MIMQPTDMKSMGIPMTKDYSEGEVPTIKLFLAGMVTQQMDLHSTIMSAKGFNLTPIKARVQTLIPIPLKSNPKLGRETIWVLCLSLCGCVNGT